MNAPGRFKETWIALGLGLLLAPAWAQGGPQDDRGRGRPKVAPIYQDETPLQSAIRHAVEKRRDRERGVNPNCQNAIDGGNEANIAKFCKLPRVTLKKLSGAECADCGDLVNPAGKVVGKRVRTETELLYESPDQRGRARWDKAMLERPDLGTIGDGVSGLGLGRGNRPRVRTATLFPEVAVNEDRDCVDTLTGQHRGGLVGGTIPADGDPASCFDSAGLVKATLVEEAGGCRHLGSGTHLGGDPTDGLDDPCFDEENQLKTTLVESIDEDAPEQIDGDLDDLVDEDPTNGANDDEDCLDAEGAHRRGADCYDGALLRSGFVELLDEDGPDFLDQDGDGQTNEDPPAADAAQGCRDFGRGLGLPAGIGDVMPDGSCDLTRAMIVELNRRGTMPVSAGGAGLGGKIFVADADGNCDLDGDGACDPALADDLDGDGTPDSVEFGKDDKRKVRVTETFTLRCKDPAAELVDGRCATPPAEAPAQADLLAAARIAPASTLVTGRPEETLESDGTRTIRQHVLMGFTFAPPVLEWGYRVEEEACVEFPFVGEVCFEVFYARFGYEFDVAVGLRLPIEVEISDIPAGSALAGQDLVLNTRITPVDFTARQYRELCEENALADGLLVADCERFSFPSFFDVLNPFLDPENTDGDEFVAHEFIFAGLIVRVLGVPVIQWGIDSAVDLPTMCSLWQIYNERFNLVGFGAEAIGTGDLLEALKSQLINCASFPTPFGLEQDPNGLPGVMRLRTFPLGGEYDVRADCLEARVRGETVKIGKKTYPICTNLILGANGASLGIGLGLEVSAGSTLISASWDALGDAVPHAGGAEPRVRYRHSPADGENEPTIGPIRVDNYLADPTQDEARVSLDDFTYHLNALQIGLKADLEFGGILTPVPDLEGFTLYNFVVDGDEIGIPIGQHAGTPGVEFPVFVENYALDLDVTPLPASPDLLSDDKTLQIAPGEFGAFLITTNNLGSVPGSFDRFARELSNRPDPSAPFTFVVHPNTDFDCTDGAGRIFRGWPYDGVADDCYDTTGEVRSDRTERIDEDPPGPAGGLEAERDEDGDGVADEDPPDVWATDPDAAGLAARTVRNVPAHGSSISPPSPTAESLVLAVSPFRHPLTAPGRYAFRVTADSTEARALGLEAVDPSGLRRLGAEDVGFVEVVSFFDPGVAVEPTASRARPGVPQAFLVEGVNRGNARDTVRVGVQFVDFNQAGCSLATLGSGPGCPYRAVPTEIPAAVWTTIAALPETFGPLQPLESAGATLELHVPGDWAGMRDTTYQVVLRGTSVEDPGAPPVSRQVVLEHTVIATPESRTRFIGLEIAALIVEIEAAIARGYDTGGLLPILMRPASQTNERALGYILAGDLESAAGAHASSVKIVEGFVHALDGSAADLPVELTSDWRARAQALLADLR